MKRAVSLADVARAAGVGKATASRALSGSESAEISIETRRHVQEVAGALGYRPNRTAQALRTGRHRTLSLIAPLADWAWWTPVIQGAALEASQRGYRLQIHPVFDGAGLEKLLDELEESHVDGVIVVTGEGTGLTRHRPAPRAATVLIDDIDPEPSYPTVRSDNRQGGYDVGVHLLQQDRRRPVIVAPTSRGAYVDQRIDGFFAAFEDAGVDLSRMAVIRTAARFESVEAVPQEISQVLSPCRNFDSVFAVSDFLAAGVLRHLRKTGISVPRQVSVVGYDDERAALLVDPPLTTVRQPFVEMGAAAVEMLTDTTCHVGRSLLLELPGRLVVRASS